MGVYVPFYYAASYSRDSLDMKYTDSLNVLLILNGVGLVGRTLPAYLADHFGPINVFIPTSAIACICVFSWMAIHSDNGLYAWASIFGIVAGGVQGLFPTAVNSLTRENELDKMGVRSGMTFTFLSLTILAGPPVAGAIITAEDRKYRGAQLFTGFVLALGVGLMIAARIVRVKRNKLTWKATV